MISPILTTEAARILHVSAETIRHWERVGKLPATKTAGGVRLFERRDVERLARERRARQFDGQRTPASARSLSMTSSIAVTVVEGAAPMVSNHDSGG